MGLVLNWLRLARLSGKRFLAEHPLPGAERLLLPYAAGVFFVRVAVDGFWILQWAGTFPEQAKAALPWYVSVLSGAYLLLFSFLWASRSHHGLNLFRLAHSPSSRQRFLVRFLEGWSSPLSLVFLFVYLGLVLMTSFAVEGFSVALPLALAAGGVAVCGWLLGVSLSFLRWDLTPALKVVLLFLPLSNLDFLKSDGVFSAVFFGVKTALVGAPGIAPAASPWIGFSLKDLLAVSPAFAALGFSIVCALLGLGAFQLLMPYRASLGRLFHSPKGLELVLKKRKTSLFLLAGATLVCSGLSATAGRFPEAEAFLLLGLWFMTLAHYLGPAWSVAAYHPQIRNSNGSFLVFGLSAWGFYQAWAASPLGTAIVTLVVVAAAALLGNRLFLPRMRLEWNQKRYQY